MNITQTAKLAEQNDNKLADLKLWFCRGCGVVHLAIGNKTMSFRHEEFRAFADAVLDAQYDLASNESILPSVFNADARHLETIH